MTDQELVQEAIEAQKGAYAPYSRFKVGAAILCKDGRVFKGCNVENVSFSLTSCAERTAVFSAVCAGARSFEAIAIVTDSEEPAFPCGACRQVLAEFSPLMRVILANTQAKMVKKTLTELFPYAFTTTNLNQGAEHES